MVPSLMASALNYVPAYSLEGQVKNHPCEISFHRMAMQLLGINLTHGKIICPLPCAGVLMVWLLVIPSPLST